MVTYLIIASHLSISLSIALGERRISDMQIPLVLLLVNEPLRITPIRKMLDCTHSGILRHFNTMLRKSGSFIGKWRHSRLVSEDMLTGISLASIDLGFLYGCVKILNQPVNRLIRGGTNQSWYQINIGYGQNILNSPILKKFKYDS